MGKNWTTFKEKVGKNKNVIKAFGIGAGVGAGIVALVGALLTRPNDQIDEDPDGLEEETEDYTTEG